MVCTEYDKRYWKVSLCCWNMAAVPHDATNKLFAL